MKKNQLKASCFLAISIFIYSAIGAQGWLLNGNAGITNTNFLGTTDGGNLIFKANNIERGRLTSSSGQWRFGSSNNFVKLDSSGKLTFSGNGDYLVGNNRYVFRSSGNSNLGLFFNSTSSQYEFRDSLASPAFTVNTITGAGSFKGSLRVGAYTLPTADGIDGQVLKTNGQGVLSFANESTGWSLTGNAGTSSALNFVGTTDLQNLAFRSNNVEVMRITTTERVGIGTTSPVAKLHINAPAGEDGFRVQIVGLTKFWVTDNGGVSVGALVQGPQDGLYVDSAIGISTFAPKAKLHIIHGNEATLTSGGSIMMGDSATTNIVMDDNEIQARNNSKISPLFLNPAGGRVQITTGTEANLALGGFFVMGDTASANLVMDNNEIQARSSNEKSTLFLNPADGLVSIGDDLDVNGDSLSLGSAEALTDAGNSEIGTNAHFIPIVDNSRQLGSSTHRWLDVWAVDGSINTSDARDKKNIRDLNYGLNDVMKLHPVKFNWKTGDNQNDKLVLIAQELQKVIPEVVRDYEFKTDEATGKNQKVASERMGVMYADLIPVLISAIQQQQKEIEELKALANQDHSVSNTTQQSINSMSVVLSNAGLEQNVPNPLKNITSIRYSIPAGAKNARLIITDVAGKTIKQIELTKAGAGVINVDASALYGGTYNYSLIIDEKIIDTKRMIISK
jgi:hypothetical protein